MFAGVLGGSGFAFGVRGPVESWALAQLAWMDFSEMFLSVFDILTVYQSKWGADGIKTLRGGTGRIRFREVICEKRGAYRYS